MIEVKFCVWHGAWRFILRFSGRVRVLGPECAGPIEAWVSWQQYKHDALPEGVRVVP